MGKEKLVQLYNKGIPTFDLKKFSNWIQELLTKVPKEFQDSARIEIEVEDDYDGQHDVTFDVHFFRPYTLADQTKEQAEQQENVLDVFVKKMKSETLACMLIAEKLYATETQLLRG